MNDKGGMRCISIAWPILFLLPWLIAVVAMGAEPAAKTDALKHGFEYPPNAARPRVWWHWLNGNVTQEGIRLDLEWMHRIGIGGFQNFDAALDTPQVVEHRLSYMSSDWKEAFLYTTKLADRLGLEEAIAGSPGWSETGGPWVKPSEGMKKYVWSEIEVEGGKPFSGTLPHPPVNAGAFQNMGNHDLISEGNPIAGKQFYADSAVLAYRLPESDVSVSALHATITTSAGVIDAAALSDGDYGHGIEFPAAPAGGTSWIRYEFPESTTIRAITFVDGGLFDPRSMYVGFGESGRDLEASDDGVMYRQVTHLELTSVGVTNAFAPVTARFFRVTFKPVAPHRDPNSETGYLKTGDSSMIRVAELVLHPGARVNRYQEKAAFVARGNLDEFRSPAVDAGDSIDTASVVDLTANMGSTGELAWTPPKGRWVIVRLGYSLLGISNHPASKEATGLEVDKLNHTFVKNYMDRYLAQYRETLGGAWMGKRGLGYVVTDSWEAGSQNWTDDMIAQFTRRRGYSPMAWLPVLTGHVVQSAEASDKFLWDFRKTIADLIADEHYGQIAASVKAQGLGHYGESHEEGRAFVGDGMEVKKLDDVPMAAMWTQTPGVNDDLPHANADIRESASVAHIYGQNIAAAESMTTSKAPWAWSPATLKPTADKELAEGVNRFVIHCSVHQPLIDKAPGLALGKFGQWFTRNETWAEMAKPWMDYLARSSYLLQQGRFAADILYFYGEDDNLTSLFEDSNPDLPEGYGFDYINADGLMHALSVQDGLVTTKSGMRYRVIGLDPHSTRMSLPVLRSLYRLVEQGATIAGVKPVIDASLADDPAEFERLTARLFGDGTGEHRVGKGIVFAGIRVGEAMSKLRLPEDFTYSKADGKTKILFVHRRLRDGDLYFVDNRNDQSESLEATFRVSGRTPELWHAETGKSEPVSYRIDGGRTTIQLRLDPWDAVFVVFRRPTVLNSNALPALKETRLADIEGPWRVNFEAGRGAPAYATFDKLASWSDSTIAGIRYFSGVGAYHRTIDAPSSWFERTSNAKLWLDLGGVDNLAEVTVNGINVGTGWHRPYRVEVTKALRRGRKSDHDQGRQCLGESADWRSTERRKPDYFHGKKPLSGRFTAAPFGPAGTGYFAQSQ